MPDDVLIANLQGRPRQAPDFSPLALEHLHTNCLAVRQLVKQYLLNPTSIQLQSLITAVSDIHHTLQLLDRRGALLVSGELTLLLKAMADQQVNDADACAHTLVLAGERLADYVAHLQKPGAIDSALPLLPVINNCRACRGEELLSEMLVVASGIDLPDGSVLPLPSTAEIDEFTQRIKDSRQPLMTGLLGWFTDEQKLQTSLSELRAVFSGLAASCDSPTSLQPLVPLFESAEFICQSVQQGGLDNSAALHKLFAQIERMLNGYRKLNKNNPAEFARPVPERLFLNLLYYVALSSETSLKAVALRRRFRLDRFVSKGPSNEGSQVQFDGVGDRLADSIRTAIELETETAREWLTASNPSMGDNEQIRRRLMQLEPAIMLLGAQESMRHINMINQSMLMLVSHDGSEHVGLTETMRERIAESLIRLEASLESELGAVRENNKDLEQTDLDTILVAALIEAQNRLLAVEEDVVKLFSALSGEPVTSNISTKDVVDQLAMIDSALQILPLPEVSPLLSGVQAFMLRHEDKVLSRTSRRDLATVMVSLGYYLNSVLQPNGAAGQLLLEAEEALLKLEMDQLELNDDAMAEKSTLSHPLFDETLVLGRATAPKVVSSTEYDATLVDYAGEVGIERFIDLALTQMSAISSGVVDYESACEQQDLSALDASTKSLSSAFDCLATEASAFNANDLGELALANVRLLSSTAPAAQLDTAVESNEVLALLEESSAVLPQLINQLQSPYDKVHGLNDLHARLEALSVQDDATLVMDIQGILERGTVADETLLDATENDAIVSTLDNTLEQVFYRECQQHMNTLKKGVDDALASRAWSTDSHKKTFGLTDSSSSQAGVNGHDIDPKNALPNRDMLRALHTLTGSAQTVNAQGVICISQPLQKAALQKQRSGERFDRSETQYIGELLAILDERMTSMDVEEALSENDPTMIRLKEFVVRSEPWMPERKQGLELNTNVSPIENVFEEEARELLAALRFEAMRLDNSSQRDDAKSRIMTCLHTIKGSARMAGQLTLADRAHNLEDELPLLSGSTLDEAVQTGLAELQTLMLVDKPVAEKLASDKPDATHAIGLTEANFDTMLSLSTQATVSQTRLGESMQRLRDAYRDIENTSARLQRLPHDKDALDSAAVQEMLSDLDSARRIFGDALLDAEAEHAHGSRADTTLHQSLIRAQLVSLKDAAVRFEYAASDAAKETAKNVDFVMSGDELSIDKALYRKIITPLEHIIRNAVVHGIESVSERIASGKSERGTVLLNAKLDGTDLVISVSDDGAGVNTKAVNALLHNKGQALVDTADAMRDILCETGFTTHTNANQLGGRGLGLATVKQVVEELDGSLHLHTPEIGGTTFTLRLPQTLRVSQIVLVEHREQCFAIPVNFVHNVFEEPQHLSHASVEYNGIAYGSCSLDAILERKENGSQVNNAKQAVLIGVHNAHFALLVDKVVGYREVIAQPLGAQLSKLERYLGGAVLADGLPALIPDFNRLLSPDKPSPTLSHSLMTLQVAKKTALIVDDSITMRVSAEMMLQSLNIEASLARDGVEAIDLLSDELPDVLLVDIDMPRMNGFDFIRHLSIVHSEHSTPIIMISTRDSEADRAKAFELGASDYIVKPYTIEQLQSALVKFGVMTA